MATRIGLGFDVHAFAEDRPLILGGVTIPYHLGRLGHSDADVLAHAVSDALLSAIRAGDIGKLFPDTDPEFKDADSIELLAHVGSLVREQGWTIVDVDTVIAAQQPKLSPHREDMRERLATALDLPVDSIGVKATTTEQLGFVGRGEGIAVWAVVLLDDAGR